MLLEAADVELVETRGKPYYFVKEFKGVKRLEKPESLADELHLPKTPDKRRVYNGRPTVSQKALRLYEASKGDILTQ